MKSTRKRKPVEPAGGASTSMNRWCSELLKSKRVMSKYAGSMWKEEAEKSARIEEVLRSAGLKPHPQYTFSLPAETARLIETCKRIEMEGWLLTVRVVNVKTGNLLYRVLDSDSRTVEAGLVRLGKNKALLVTVTPNRPPTVSGTLCASNGDAFMEMVYGPHHWLTKAAPDGVELQRCWFAFPHLSVSYGTLQTDHREMLYRHLTTVLRIGLGMSLGEFAETRSSLYAEFQWDSRSGYKFFDISYASVWTGSTASVRESSSLS